ncbi:unnamed protein product [Trifolium pratense]|uniref:Uncharacterized protein n=1 Tax=Trifolium pratense TaxID=57577 RepID=A0ACB0K036_TRIPR|nr:unnamed protein product [Trifolium pratense]
MQQNNKRKRDHRPWSDLEVEAFLDILIEVVNNGQRCDNGQFKVHTLRSAETKLEEKFPGCGIKVKPHIESTMKRLRTTYAIVYDMLNQSGFGWDEEKKIIKVDDEVWNEYVKSHPNAKDHRYAPIPLFDKLAHAFGKDRATGKGAAPPADNVEEIDKEDEDQGNDEENEIGMTHLPSINQSKRKADIMEIQFGKRNKGASIIAQSISELGKSFGSIIEKSSKNMCEAANRLGFGKDLVDDSRNLMAELEKIEITEQERFIAADKILSVPHRLHIFMGCHGGTRLQFVKSLIG